MPKKRRKFIIMRMLVARLIDERFAYHKTYLLQIGSTCYAFQLRSYDCRHMKETQGIKISLSATRQRLRMKSISP